MKRRMIGYAAWLLLAGCLYFFENNTGTRIVLLCSLLFLFLPALRHACFLPDEKGRRNFPETQTVRTFILQETEEPGGVRAYVPGDPVRLIHWKLSAKMDKLLVRETAAVRETVREQRAEAVPARGREKKAGGFPAAAAAAGILCCLVLLLVIPEASRGAQALCNRLFDASEAVNTYVYRRFSVPDGQGTALTVSLLICIAALLPVWAAAAGSRLPALGIMAACTLFQVYFGLSFSAWINIPLYGLLGLRMLGRPFSRRPVMIYCGLVLAVSLLMPLVLPGTDAATEAASERIRDRLALVAEQMTGTLREDPDGETETRRVHTRSMAEGDHEAETEREFRLVTVEETRISMPRWVDWIRMILLLLLAVALVTLPFAPFVLLNARKRKARESREAFRSDNPGEAVRAIFREVIVWLEATGHGAGNLLYRNWSGLLPETFPEGYADRFARCAADCEEASYSRHAIPERKRQEALELLKETEAVLWKAAGRRQRFYLKYWMCLHE